MPTTIDSLQIEIEARAQSASSGIDALAASLKKLKTAVGTAKGVSALSANLNQIKSALAGLSDPGGKLANIASGLSAIGNVKVSATLGKNLGSVSAATSGLIGTDYSGIKTLAEALAPLSSLGKNNLTSFLTQLKKVPQIMEELSHVDMGVLRSRIQGLSDAFAPLANQMSKISAGFAAFPSRIQRLITSQQRLTSSTYRSTTSYVNLAAKMGVAYFAVRRISGVIASWITKSNQYIENLNLFNATMGEFADKGQEYAEKVGQIIGIDPGEWMRNQGMFMALATGFGVVSDRAEIMSRNLTQLGYDISSFFNISFEDSMAKLQSGLAGELEPLRRIGYDLSVARLQQEAYRLGIDRSVMSMTQAEKAELRYYAIMTQVTVAQGDMARTLEAPSNQLRILNAQVSQAARALGNIFIPALNAILPYAIAFVKVLRTVAQAIASLFGFTLPEVDYSGLEHVAAGGEEVADSLGGAAGKAKELKTALLGVDELNVISPPESGGGGGGTGGGGAGGGLDFELPTYDFLGDAISKQVDDIVKGLEKLTPLFLAGGAALATWKLGEFLSRLFGVRDVMKALTGKDWFKMLSGLLLTVGGAILYVSSAIDVIKNGMNWGNLGGLLAGIAAAVTGVYLAVRPFVNKDVAFSISGWAAVVGGLGTLALSLADIGKNGASIENLAGSIIGLGTAIGGLHVALKKSTSAIAPFAAPLVALIGSLGILHVSITDLVKNGATTENFFGVVAGAIGAVTAAVWLCTAAMAKNPIFGAVAIGVSVVAGIATVIGALTSAETAIYESTEEFLVMERIINRSAEASERATTALEGLRDGVENLDSVTTDFTIASRLVDEIFDINENAFATNYELELMAVKVGVLNGLNIDGLSLSIDETTGRVTKTRAAVEELIASLEKQARLEALNNLLVKAYETYYQSELDLTKAMRDRDTAYTELTESQKKLIEGGIGPGNAALVEQKKAFEASEQAMKDINDTMDEANGNIKALTGGIIDLKTEEVGVGDVVRAGLAEVERQAGETADRMTGYGSEVSANWQSGVREQNASLKGTVLGFAKSIMDGIMGLPQKFKDTGAAGVSGYNSGITANAGTSYSTTYGYSAANVKIAKDVFSYGALSEIASAGVGGFNGGIIASSGSSQSPIVSWGSRVLNWFAGTASSGAFGSQASAAISGFNNGISSGHGSSVIGMSTWGNAVKNIFSGIVSAGAFGALAGATIGGFNNGIAGGYGSSANIMLTWGNAIKNALSSNLVASEAFGAIAGQVIAGFNNGISSRQSSTSSVMASWGRLASSAMQRTLEQNSPSRLFYEIAEYTVAGFNNGIEVEGRSTKGIVSSWADSFTSVDPAVSLSVDSSALQKYDTSSFAKTLSSTVASNVAVDTEVGDMEEAVLNALVRSGMVSDLRRQADKEERTVLNVDGRAVAETVRTQNEKNGYQFIQG